MGEYNIDAYDHCNYDADNYADDNDNADDYSNHYHHDNIDSDD